VLSFAADLLAGAFMLCAPMPAAKELPRSATIDQVAAIRRITENARLEWIFVLVITFFSCLD
jgi:hypothetical protein